MMIPRLIPTVQRLLFERLLCGNEAIISSYPCLHFWEWETWKHNSPKWPRINKVGVQTTSDAPWKYG